MDATAVTDEQRTAFMPYLMAISQKIGEIKPETTKAIMVDSMEKSDEFKKQMTDNFEASDANKDGVLDADEFVAFEKKRCEY